jgi:hypothetical protein
MLDRYFGLSARGTTVGTESRGGLTTFMVMAYIIFVNPTILSFAGIDALRGQGPPFAGVQAATCLVAGVMTMAMGLATNYPLAIASGMGLNAVVAFQLIAGMKLPWPAAMGVVFHHQRHRRRVRHLLLHQGDPRQGRRGPPHDVRGHHRLPPLLRDAGFAAAARALSGPGRPMTAVTAGRGPRLLPPVW